MSAEVDRDAFLRMMGLTAADVADPDSLPTRTSSRNDHTHSSKTGANAVRGAPRYKIHSPAVSSAAGLSHSASLPGDSDHITNSYASMKTSLNVGAGTKLSSTFTPSTDRSSIPLKPSARSVSFETPPQRSVPTASASPRSAPMAEALKEEGNCAFESGLFTEAIRNYSAAIDALSHAGVTDRHGAVDVVPGSTPTCSAEVELLAALHSNRSAAYLQAARQWSSTEEALARALCDADRAVTLRPSWFKGYTRQGDAYFKLRRYGTAAEAYEMALQLDPKNTTLTNALAETRLRAKQSAREELEMRRTMRATGGSHMSSMRGTGREVGEGTLSEKDSFSYQTASTALFSETDHHAGVPRRSSGQAQQLWEDLKHEVEVTTHEPTGDAYRLQQLERFRHRGGAAKPDTQHTEARGAAGVHRPCPVSESNHKVLRPSHHPELAVPSPLPSRFRDDGSTSLSPTSAPAPLPRRSSYDTPTSGGIPAAMANFGGPVTSARDVPYEFSSAAASAYQQKLLEAFRHRKGR